jgi:hypothetical protein
MICSDGSTGVNLEAVAGVEHRVGGGAGEGGWRCTTDLCLVGDEAVLVSGGAYRWG